MYEFVLKSKDGNKITLPVNPEKFTIPTTADSETTEVVGLGEVNQIKKRKLIKLKIESFLYNENGGDYLIPFIQKAVDNEEPIELFFEAMYLNIKVSVTNFEVSIEKGQEYLRKYVLELLEWVDYSPQLVNNTQQQSTTSTEQPQEPQTAPKVGDLIIFNGGSHYYTSTDTTPAGKPRTAGLAKITLIVDNAPNKYHVVGQSGGSDVNGWIKEGSFTRA